MDKLPEIINDYFLVAIDKKYKDDKTEAGIITLNSAYIDEEDGDRYIHRVIKGEVVSVPKKFTNKDVHPIDLGMPPHVKSMSGHQIESLVKMGNRSFSRKDYKCTTFERYPSITMADIGARMDLVVGDTVYFDYRNTDEEENVFTLPDGRSVYKMTPNTIYCAVRNGKIQMQGMWVIVKPNMETWEEIKTESGIIKKPQPEAKYLEGIIMHTNSEDYGKPGDLIIYIPDSDCELEIENQKVYLMMEREILGKLDEDVPAYDETSKYTGSKVMGL